MFSGWKSILVSYLFLTSSCSARVMVTTTEEVESTELFQQSAQEPLLRFPFSHYLANPCGVGPVAPHLSIHRPINNNETSENVTIMRIISADEPLDVQSRRFVANFQERYSHRRNISGEERLIIDRELHLVFHESRNLIGQIYSTTAIPNCNGIRLHSLGDVAPIVSSTGNIHGLVLYRELLIATAHLHLMVRDIVDSGRYCLHESFIQRRLIHLLTGKLESMMCLILQSGAASPSRFFSMTADILPLMVFRNHECSSRQIRSCLVLNYTQQILGSIDHLFTNASRGVDNSDFFRYYFLID